MKGCFQVSGNFLGRTGIPPKTVILTFGISFACHAILIGALFFLPGYSKLPDSPFPSTINVSLVSLKGFDKISGDMPENQPGNKKRAPERPAGMSELPGDSIRTDIPAVSRGTEATVLTDVLPPSVDQGYTERNQENELGNLKHNYYGTAGGMSQSTGRHTWGSIPRYGHTDIEMSPIYHNLKEAVPLYKENPTPVYPFQAKKRGYEGTVILEVLVTKEGKAGKVSIFQSSRYSLLDESAVSSVKKWRFEPGKRGDEKVDMPVKIPIRFKLETD
jgi:TonB family protein